MNSAAAPFDVILHKAQAQVGKRRIFLKSFFADFDHLHCGRISGAQFARVLTNNDVHLSPAEMRVLVEGFAAPHADSGRGTTATNAAASSAADGAGYEGTEVLYEDFLGALEAGPGSSAAVRRTLASATLTPEEEARLKPFQVMLQHAIGAHGTSLTEPFRDLDPLRTGCVTVAQFCRCLPFSSSLSAEAMDLFAKQYSDGRGGVYYMPWCRAMDPSLCDDRDASEGNVGGTIETAQSRTNDKNSSDLWKNGTVSSLVCPDSFTNPHLSAEELIAIFRQQRALYRVRYEDAFADYDKMKTGKVTVAQFESVLGRMPLVHFALRSENIHTLARAYISCRDGRGDFDDDLPTGSVVEYRAFLRDIHPSQAMHTTADGQSVPVNFFAASHAADTYVTTAEDQRKADALLAQLRALVQSNRICLSPVLRDFDRVRKGIYEHRTCTRTRFARGLATQNIMLPADQLQLLIRKYTVPNPDGSPSSEVNYYLFVQDVDPSQASGTSGANCTAAASNQTAMDFGVPSELRDTTAPAGVTATTSSPAPPTKEAVLAHVALQVVARRLHVSSFFSDVDTLRSGTMSKNRLGTALGQAGLQLPPEELVILQDAFACPRIRDTVDTQRLAAQVDAAVAALNASRAMEKSGGEGASTGKDADSQAQLNVLLSRVRHNVHVHNALLLPFFADFDRHHRGIITPTQFAQACMRHHLPLSQVDLEALSAWYSAGDGTKPGSDGVRYLAFVRDVGSEEESMQYALAQTAASEARMAASAPQRGGTAGDAGGHLTASARAAIEAAADVDDVLMAICIYLQERRPCLTEFFPDGDELRHQHVTPTRFRHCLTMLGLTNLTEAQLRALEAAFASSKCPGEVDYPAFVCTVRAMQADGAGVAGVTQRRLHGSVALARGDPVAPAAARLAGDGATATEQRFATTTLQRIQRTLKARRTATIAAFREYDRARKGFVTEGQFFACLQALGVPLKPDEAAALLTMYAVGDGQVHYLAFAHEVDDASLINVS